MGFSRAERKLTDHEALFLKLKERAHKCNSFHTEGKFTVRPVFLPAEGEPIGSPVFSLVEKELSGRPVFL